MSTAGPLHDDSRDPLDLLAEQFLLRVRKGEPVTPESFAGEHPEHGPQLLDLLPTLLLLEQAKRERESTASSGRRLSIPQLQQLGDFRIVREVGRGGMGVVFEAVQESLGRRVALKVLPQASLLTGHQLERFRREAQTAARLHHTHIVPVFDSGEADGFHYYAMQFIDGSSLDAVIKQQRAAGDRTSASLREQCRLAAQIGVAVASALEHAHALGTLHRDIKPANLLLDDKQHVWVTDFGLAKALQQEGLTVSGDVLGTLQYMAPEQFAGQYDVRSEVYALGATIHELVALRPAFAGETRSELIDRIRAGRCERLGRRVPGVPRDLETIVSRAMATEPRARYASARELGDDLRAFLEDRPIAARRQSSTERFVYWCRRNRALASAGAVAIVAVVAAAVIGWTSWWVTKDALESAEQSATRANQASERDRANLKDTLQVFEDVFDTLVGPDPLHALIDDDSDGTAEVVQRAPLDEQRLALLDRMLEFYDKFAQRNQDSAELREQTARAYGRMGAIQARLGEFDDAVAAYEKAIARFRDVTAHDVTRDIAGLQQELGSVQVRRDQPIAAADQFTQSLKLLEGDVADTSRSSRRLQARAHFLLATVYQFGPGRQSDLGARGGPLRGGRRDGGGRPGQRAGERRPLPDGRMPRPGDRPGDRPPPDRSPEQGPPRQRLERFERLANEARDHLAAAMKLLVGLLAEQADDAESQFLQARCLLALARLPRPDSEAERAEARQHARTILDQLVTAHPDVESYRFEYAEALQPDRRSPEFVADLHRAVEHAEFLTGRQPEHPEYQRLLARSLSLLGSALHARDGATQPQAGAQELRRAVQLQRALAARGGTDRIEMDLLDSVRRLLRVLVDAHEVAEAQPLAREFFDNLLDARRRIRGGPPDARPPDARSPDARPPDDRIGEFENVLERLGLPELAARWRAEMQQQPGDRRDGERRGR